ncbi:hypothetical protein CAEBREN_22092 [Caenorhabditis brenneri]|uniref:Endonuclease/exonuclease/phosphatase domain-containing protein n=1 Tax=Caenorhabditis brenneri TaxID=135651 RepID=G0M8V0_CAEBE|nr:hypothetical protein CAEBREN_22092 [Caenorhabditis brenneri]
MQKRYAPYHTTRPNHHQQHRAAERSQHMTLAKNASLTRAKRVEEIIVEEDEGEEAPVVVTKSEDDEEIEVIQVIVSPRKEVVKSPVKPAKNRKKKSFLKNFTPKEDADDDSIIVIGEVPRQNKMTQSNSTMADSCWESKPTSSSTASSSATTSSTVIGTSITTTTTIIDTSIPPPSLFPTSSSSSSTKSASSWSSAPKNRPLMKLLDGYSKDCTANGNPGVRRWMKVKMLPNAYDVPASATSKFTICSYNVLCQKTVERTNYLYRHLTNEPHFLMWDHRWKGLQEELPTFNADILGLQEVQADHYHQHFEPFMKKHNYKGIYKQKFGTQQKDDGCAIFYRSEKFEKVAYEGVNYFVSDEAISNRENIAQILALRCLATREVIIVANTHLLFNEERGDVKLAQLGILFAAINKMRTAFGVSSEFRETIPPVIVMGDFNMEPNSQIYKFVVEGRLFVEGQFIRTMSGQSVRTGGRQCRIAELLGHGAARRLQHDGHISHPFEFVSAYHYSPDGRPAPIVPENQRCISTYHKDKAAPDFIFYTKELTRWGVEKLQLLERFELPTSDTLRKAKPWPNKNVPSDHLPIIAKFQLTKDSP